MTVVTVKQNGKNEKLPTLKDGRTNFAPGFRKDRELTSLKGIKAGDLVVRDRGNERNLIKVLEVSQESFQGQYTTPKGKTVTERAPRSFRVGPSEYPVYRARPSR